MRTYQNMCTHNAYLTGSVYFKSLPKRKVKVRLNQSKFCKVRLNLIFLRGNPS